MATKIDNQETLADAKGNLNSMISTTIYTVILIVNSATCPKPEVIVEPGFTMNEHDNRILKDAEENGCKRHFGQDSCLIRFVKKQERTYHAICSSRK